MSSYLTAPVLLWVQGPVFAPVHFSFTNPQIGVFVVVTGIDMTAGPASPVQCFVDFSLDAGSGFFHDSQSTGEGLGVYFSWRGAIPIPFNHSLDATLTANASIQVGSVAWGYVTTDTGFTGV